MPEPNTLMPTLLPFMSAMVLIGEFVLHRPVDREAAGPLAHVLGDDVGLQVGLRDALRQREHALRRAVERAGHHRLHHRRGALELRPFDLVALAEIGELLRPCASSNTWPPPPEWSSRRGSSPARRRPTAQTAIRRLPAQTTSSSSCLTPSASVWAHSTREPCSCERQRADRAMVATV